MVVLKYMIQMQFVQSKVASQWLVVEICSAKSSQFLSENLPTPIECIIYSIEVRTQ